MPGGVPGPKEVYLVLGEEACKNITFVAGGNKT